MKKFLRNTLYTVLAVAAIIAFFTLRSMFSFDTVSTGSMAPTMPIGTIALVQHTQDIKKGEIISFQQTAMPRPIDHRFVGYNKDGSLIREGDANRFVDDHPGGPLQKSSVIGKVIWTVPYFVAGFWTTFYGFLVLGILGVTAIVAALYAFRTRKDKDKEEGLPSEQTSERELETTPV
jgi:signal peptidase I